MTKEINSYLKRRSKLAKKYYNNATDYNKNLLVNTATEGSKLKIADKKISRFACNTRVIVDANLSLLVSRVKLL